MPRIDRDKLGEQLSAYLDGELNAEDRAAVDATLRNDPSARAELERLRDTAHAVRDLPRCGAPASVAADVMATIERGDLLDAAPPPNPRSWSWRPWSVLLMTAAMLAVAVTVGLWGISQSESGRTVARMASSADVDDIERELSQSEPLTDSAAGDRGAMRETNREERSALAKSPAEAAVPPVLAMAEKSGPSEADGDQFGNFQHSAPASMKSALGRQDAGNGSDDSAGAEVQLDVHCPSEVDLRWCVNRVGEFMTPGDGGKQDEPRSSTVAVLNRGTTPIGQDNGTVAFRQTIRIPQSRLRHLVELLETEDPQLRDVTMTVGEVVQARGWRQSKELSSMVYAQATRDQRSLPKDRYADADSPLEHADEPARRNRMAAAARPRGEIENAISEDQSDDKAEERKKDVLDNWLERFGVPIPRDSKSEEPSAGRSESVSRDRRSQSRSTREKMINVIVRFRAPADPLPPGPPGELVPRDR